VNTPRVVGLDLSLTATGICLPDGTTHTIKTNAKDGDARLVHIAHTLANALSGGADLAVVEDLPVHAKSAGITGMVHGVARAVLLEAGIPYALVVPATLKKYATGVGNGDKTPMAIAALKRAGREFADDNQCDAAWLRWAGLDYLGHAEFQLPAGQRESLAKMKWPTLASRSAA
jgi:Holliday junction resolvasome RuvABC endonuclease subunit